MLWGLSQVSLLSPMCSLSNGEDEALPCLLNLQRPSLCSAHLPQPVHRKQHPYLRWLPLPQSMVKV